MKHFSLTPALGKGNCLHWCFSGRKMREMSNLPKQTGKRTTKKSQDQGYGNGCHFHWLQHGISLEKEMILRGTGLRTLPWKHSGWAWLEMGIETGGMLQGNQGQRGSSAKNDCVTKSCFFFGGMKINQDRTKSGSLIKCLSGHTWTTNYLHQLGDETLVFHYAAGNNSLLNNSFNFPLAPIDYIQ